MREAGKKQLIIGLVIAGIGLAISVGSYAAASSNGGGGYFLMFGLVIVGLMRAFRGFSMMKAASSAPAVGAPAIAPAMPATAPAMPPRPRGAAPAPVTDLVRPQAANPASPPPPPAPPSMWD